MNQKPAAKLVDAVTFVASIRAGNSGLQIGDDGAQLHLDVPETELARVLPAIRYRGQRIQVTIQEA